MSDEAAIKAKVEVLAKVFSGRLHVRYEKMAAAFTLCQADSANDAHWVELHRLLHSLAGAAGSFGFDALGAAAGRVEQQVKALLADSRRHPHDIHDIGLALTALQQQP
jgi:HPt (histidine-containing phosphotransfer) domain-containing protein